MNKLFKNIGLILFISLFHLVVSAQELTDTLQPSLWDKIGTLEKMMFVIAILLLVPIYYISKIFNWSLKHYLKQRFESKSTKILPLIFWFSLPILLEAQTKELATSSFDQFNFLRWFLIIVILVEVLILGFFGRLLYKQFSFIEGEKQELEKQEFWLISWWKRVNNFGAIDQESKIDTGHNYDGIRELDNKIPVWFTASFVISILFSMFYLWEYHIAKISPLSAEEYNISIEEAELEHQRYLKTAGSGIDENTLVFSNEKTEIEEGKKMFLSNCASCHVADGGGNQGPNLTDNMWIYGCTPKDVYQSIKYGRKNGMMAWKDNFSDKQIVQLASFVKSLQGTHPAAPKAPQGQSCDMNATASSVLSLDSITNQGAGSDTVKK